MHFLFCVIMHNDAIKLKQILGPKTRVLCFYNMALEVFQFYLCDLFLSNIIMWLYRRTQSNSHGRGSVLRASAAADQNNLHQRPLTAYEHRLPPLADG